MTIQLIKSEENIDDDVTTPRWVYHNIENDTFTKIIPYFYTPDTILENQIDLINQVCGFELIIDHDIIELDEKWSTDSNEFRNTNQYLKYTMVRSLGEPLQESNISDYLNDIVFPYIEVAAKIFPYANIDCTTGNVFYSENGYSLIDWDNVILGHKTTPYDFYKSLHYEVVELYVDPFGRRVSEDTFLLWYQSVVKGSVLDLNL